MRSHGFARALVVLPSIGIAFTLGACGGERDEPGSSRAVAGDASRSPVDAGQVAREPFVQRIEGTTVEFRMVPIERGEVMLAGAGDASPTSIGVDAFYIAETETTWDLFDVFVYGLDVPEGAAESDAVTRPSKPYVPPDRGFGHAGFPAISMTYQSAEAFCGWLSAKTGRAYRLPTEAEWLLVAERCAGDAPIQDREWFASNSDSQTHAVAQKVSCATGVHDLLGNAAEWVAGIDGKPAVRGGAYSDPAGLIAPTTRRTQTPAWNMSDPQMPKSRWWLPDAPFVGFRLVCEIEEGAGDEAGADND